MQGKGGSKVNSQLKVKCQCLQIGEKHNCMSVLEMIMSVQALHIPTIYINSPERHRN